MKRILLLTSCLLSTPVLAQQQPPDPVMLQRGIAVLQAQRNQAMDVAAIQQARADGLTEDLAKAQARIKELEPKQQTGNDH